MVPLLCEDFASTYMRPGGTNHGRTGDADLRNYVGAIRIAEVVLEFSGTHRGLARPKQADMPELRSGVCIESVDAIALRGHKYNVMRTLRQS